MIYSGNAGGQPNAAMTNLSAELISDPGEVLNALAESKEKGTTVGIDAPLLGDEMFVTAVHDIVIGEEITIVLKSYDRTGYILGTNKLKLGEIRSVCPFKSPFENPFMRTLRNDKPL